MVIAQDIMHRLPHNTIKKILLLYTMNTNSCTTFLVALVSMQQLLWMQFIKSSNLQSILVPLLLCVSTQPSPTLPQLDRCIQSLDCIIGLDYQIQTFLSFFCQVECTEWAEAVSCSQDTPLLHHRAAWALQISQLYPYVSTKLHRSLHRLQSLQGYYYFLAKIKDKTLQIVLQCGIIQGCATILF